MEPSSGTQAAGPQTAGMQSEDVRALIDKSASRLLEQANDGLRRFSDTLRNKDLDQMVREAESFARRQPALFLGAAALAGFLAVRFLKSSSPRDDGNDGRSTGAPGYGTARDGTPGQFDTPTPFRS